MKISQSPRFLKDVKKFKNVVENINDPKKKIYYKKLFDRYCMQVKIIDENHNSFSNSAISPNTIRENVKELQELRWQLEQMSKHVEIKQ